MNPVAPAVPLNLGVIPHLNANQQTHLDSNLHHPQAFLAPQQQTSTSLQLPRSQTPDNASLLHHPQHSTTQITQPQHAYSAIEPIEGRSWADK